MNEKKRIGFIDVAVAESLEAIGEALAGKTRAQPGRVGCFIAGTLVHTREGLKPIEQIQVGDDVLSKPENGGEQTYKRVTKTFQHENREVCLLIIQPEKEIATARAEKRTTKESEYSCLIGTPNHPIWVKGKGWTSLKGLDFYDEMEFANGEVAMAFGAYPLHRTHTEGVALLHVPPTDFDSQSTIDLRVGQSFEYYPWWKDEPLIAKGYWGDDRNDYELFRTTVYNLEVEDCHSYYVGTRGIWVHNTSGEETAGQGVISSSGNERYFPPDAPKTVTTLETAMSGKIT